MTDNITPGERRELRSVVRGQYKVLRAEVKRREAELKAEVESELLDRYRYEDRAIADARHQVNERIRDCLLEIQAIAAALTEAHPDVVAEGYSRYGQIGFSAENCNRTQLHRAALAAIPNTISDANLGLDRSENDLLRKLSEGALASDDARGFLALIPTVGELVPHARLVELERGMS